MASVTFSLISSIVPVSCIAFCCLRNLHQYQLRCCYCWVCCWCCMAFCFGITVLRVRLLLLPCCAAQLCRSSCLMPVFVFKVIPPWLILLMPPLLPPPLLPLLPPSSAAIIGCPALAAATWRLRHPLYGLPQLSRKALNLRHLQNSYATGGES